jgi:phospholipase C
MTTPKIVILCLENRSFDEYFGTFPGAIGFYDPAGVATFTQPGFSETPAMRPFRTSTFSSSAECLGSCSHFWPHQHVVWNYGALNGWSAQDPAAVQATDGQGSGVHTGPVVMGYYAANDIPYHWTLAQNFLLCDSYFCSVLSSTEPNRVALMTGTVFDPETLNNLNPNQPVVTYAPITPIIDNDPGVTFSWMSYPGILGNACTWTIYDDQVAGQQWAPPWLAWKNPAPTNPVPGEPNLPAYLAFVYPSGTPPCWPKSMTLNVLDLTHGDPGFPNSNGHTGATMTPYYSATPHSAATSNFENDAASGVLPAVSWILPPSYCTAHPAYYLPADAECYLARVVEAVVKSPHWGNEGVVLIITYDENDGHFDHVVPPTSMQNQLQENGAAGGLAPLPTPVQSMQNANNWATAPQPPAAGEVWEPWIYANVEGGPTMTGPAGAGFRVPTIIVSPWTFGANGGVSSTLAPSKVFDHTSIIQYIEEVLGETPQIMCVPNLPLNGWRRSTFSSLGTLIDTTKTAATKQEVLNALPSHATVDAWRLDALTRLFGATPPGPTAPNLLLPNPAQIPLAQVFPPLQQQCYLIMNKTAFGLDEVKALSELQNNGNQNGPVTFSNAFWVVVDGFDPAEVGLAYVPTVPGYLAPQATATLTLGGQSVTEVTVLLNATPVPDNPGPPPLVPERFRYTCDIYFPQGVSAFSALQVSQSNPVVLNLNASFASRLTWNAPTEQIELVATADPYIQNGPELTQNMDLRVFTVPADGQSTFFGQTIDPTNPNPILTLQQALSALTAAPSMWPAPPDPTNAQQEEAVSTVTVFPTLNGGTTVSASNPLVFCFAIVRVTLQGVTALADNVRVFFRLVPAANTGVSYDQTTLYRSTPLPGQPNPSGSTADTVTTPNYNTPSPPPSPPWQTRVPLLGLGPIQPPPLKTREILTIPFFATPRIDATQNAMYTQPPDWPNTQRITPNLNGEPVYAFFGSWLDINVDPASTVQGNIVGADTLMFPAVVPAVPSSKLDGPYTAGQYQPISAFVKSQHQCIIAEVAYDPLPIPPGAIPGENQQLAQRNLFVVGGTN